MESDKSSSIIDDINVKGSSVDLSSKKKIKLKKEIEDLKYTLQQLKKQLHVVKFRNSLTENNTYDMFDMSNNGMTPIDIQLELYRYGGLYFMKSDYDKKVVGFNSAAKEQHKNEFAVQFVKQGNNIKTGKWVMPMSVSMEQLQSEVQLQSVRNVLYFIRNCKQHTDCYESRLQQFKELKSSADNLRNCNVQTNLGYTLFTLELLHVYNKTNDSYFNVSIYLWYNSKCGRPTNIKFEIPESTTYDKETKMQLKKSLNVFRSNDLRTAFHILFNENNKQFTWTRAEKAEDILEINESSSSLDDEISLYERLKRKRLKEKLKKQSNKKKKKANSSNDLNPQSIDVDKMNKPSNSKTPLKVNSNTVKGKVMHQSTLDKFTKKLNSTKKKKKDSKIIKNKFSIKPSEVRAQKLVEKYTSTPIKPNPQNNTPFKVLPNIDISKITLNNSDV